MSEDWQFCYRVKGLGIPEKKVTFGNDILMRGVPFSDNSDVFFKVPTNNEEEREKFRKSLYNELMNILRIYGIVANLHVEPLNCDSRAKISSETPFGDTKISPRFGFYAVIPEEQRIKTLPLVKKTISIYKANKSIFQEKQKGFLANALDYYLRSLGDLRLEEKLIDSMIAFESLFSTSKERQELRRSYSLRASFLLSVGIENKRAEIYQNIYDLYGKRNKVVHGTRGINMTIFEISIFQGYVREAIKHFIPIEIAKDEILELIDKSVYDEAEKEQFNLLVLEAIKKIKRN